MPRPTTPSTSAVTAPTARSHALRAEAIAACGMRPALRLSLADAGQIAATLDT